MAVLAQHSAATVEHGTPHEVVALARHVLGEIELDPFSNAYWNEHVVKADDYCDESTNALDPLRRWVTVESGTPKFGTMFINPPGGLVKEAWRFACERWCEGSSVFWVGFNIEQLSYLQGQALMFRGFRRVIPPRRLAFLRRPGDVVADLTARIEKAQAERKARALMCELERFQAAHPDPSGPPVRGMSPTHSNYLCLLPRAPEQIERFEAAAQLMPAEVF